MMFAELSPPYATIVADPPWAYNATVKELRSGGRGGQAEHAYSTMTNAEIAYLPVRELAAEAAHLYLWVTVPRLFAEHNGSREVGPVEIVEAWGFEPKTMLTWVKPGAGGMGWYFRGQTEHVIFATRGGLGIPADKREPNVFTASRHGHSVKPACFFDLVERVSPGSYLELFSRTPRLGWDSWGHGYELASTESTTPSGDDE
jgi:N6-adenosine-specific RNA methylase IME4